MTRALALLLPALLLPFPAAAAPPRPSSPAPTSPGADAPASDPTLDWTFSVLGGGFSGKGTRTDQGALAEATLQGEVAWTSERRRLAVPFLVAHQQTFGASLLQTVGAVGLEPTWRLESGARLGLEAALRGEWRPDWPDQYQRTAAGQLPPTDRYTNAELALGAQGWWQPAARQHLRLRYRFLARRYVRDAGFDPTVPTHLTPSDENAHELRVSWRSVGEQVAWSLRLDASLTDSLVLPARDAITASSAGNPLQRLMEVEPRVEVELFRDRAAELQVSYGFRGQRDTWDGYYSFGAHRPEVSVRWRVTRRLAVEGRLAVQLVQYGSNAKSGASPTPTEDGKDRWDDKTSVKGQIRYRVRHGLHLVGEGEWTRRRTNYPDYRPGVYPASRFYDIDFDYDNVRAVAGVEWRP